MTDDPMLNAIMSFVAQMCRLAVAEATGFHSASVLEPEREKACATFVREMEKTVEEKDHEIHQVQP